MGYVEKHLLPGEEIMHRAYLHKIVYFVPVLFAILFIVVGTIAFANDLPGVAAVALMLALIPLVWAQIVYTSSEFAVTNKRVVIKVGFIQRRTLETLLSKVEAIEVDQGVFARMLNYGTIAITGTGGTRELFRNIAAPLEFRRQVHAQVTATEYPVERGVLPREERDCPYCAERILVRARLCKHCGKTVEPLVTP
jgi:uncharacterized membrane protein YdbT with pleckstrin-like domain